MKRLTKRDENGHTWLCDMDISLNPREFIDRLAAYEDTGLEPEEISVMLERYRAFRSAISDETGQPMVSWTRAGEICRAEQDGRLIILPFPKKKAIIRDGWYRCHSDFTVNDIDNLLSAWDSGRLMVLPCKVGDMVYGHSETEVYEYKVAVISLATYNWYFRCQNYNSDFWCTDADIGRTVFLTREEAEAALAGGEG